jgi:hypothetical protein
MASPLQEDESFPDEKLDFIPDLINLDNIEPISTQGTFPDTFLNQSLKRTQSVSRIEKDTLSLFINKNNRPPKKEYLRIQIIRSFKRSIREGLNRKVPNKKLGEVIESSSQSRQAWEDFMNFVNEYSVFFTRISRTDTGPQTEARSQRTIESNSKSFNDQFCRQFFSESFVREAYSLFVQVVFACLDCKVLIRKFGFKPKVHRNSRTDSIECEENWNKLKTYVMTQMIKDLGVSITEA